MESITVNHKAISMSQMINKEEVVEETQIMKILTTMEQKRIQKTNL